MKTKLGIYIHIPFCNGKCAYCDFVSGVYPDKIKETYFFMLQKEICEFDFSGYAVDSIYFGGGTPSSVDARFIADTLNALLQAVEVACDAEISIECNPESFSEEKAAAYSAAGINRVSFGVQTASDKLLAKISRLHSFSDFEKAAEIAAKYFSNISADLMLGLPDQTLSDVVEAIDKVSRHVRHISVYALKVEDDTPIALSGYSVDEDFEADCYEAAENRLKNCGFLRYEVSNFALKGAECRHNLKYWSLEDYVGFGIAAHSYLRGVRTANTPSIDDYLAGKKIVSTHEIKYGSAEDCEEFVMLAIRTAGGIDLEKFEARFGCKLEESRADAIKKLVEYIEVKNNKLYLKPHSYYIMNRIIGMLLY